MGRIEVCSFRLFISFSSHLNHREPMEERTSGSKGGTLSFLYIASQSIPVNQGCDLISSNPFPPVRYPNLLPGSRSINYHQSVTLFHFQLGIEIGLTARIHCMPDVEHLSATSSGHAKCSCKIAFVNAVFVRPLNGRLPNNSSYLSVSWPIW
jgi:hypothetical protein